MVNETIGFGILGAGVAANLHRQAIVDNGKHGARLVAVVDYFPERFNETCARFGVPCVSEDELLANKEVDVVCICTPSGQHAAQAMAAIRAGKHVLVEKPMALSLADADAMIEASDRAGVLLGVVLQRRVDPLFSSVYSAIRRGDLGELTLGLVTIPYHRPQSYFDQASWRGTWAMDGGGVLMNQGIHLVDLLIWFMGDPVQVWAQADTLHRNIEVEDTLAAVLRFENGAVATITATTTVSPGFPHRVEIYGTNGGIQLEGETLRKWTLSGPTELHEELFGRGRPATAGAASDPRAVGTSGHTAVCREFIQSLRAGEPARIDGLEGRRSLSTILAIYEAAGVLQQVAEGKGKSN